MEEFDKTKDFKKFQAVTIKGMYRGLNGEKLDGVGIFIGYRHGYNPGGHGPWCLIQIEGRICPWPLAQVERPW